MADTSIDKTTHRIRRQRFTAAAIVLTVLMTGYGLLTARASGFFTSTEPEQGSLSGNAGLVSDAGASGGQAVRFNAPAPSPSPTPTPPPSGRSCPPLPAFPTAACTGLPPGTSLTLMNGDVTFATTGAVIDGKHITGDVTITANNITIKNSQIDGSINNWGGGNPYTYTITDSTVGPASGCNSASAIGSGRFTATRVLVRNSSDGFRISSDSVTIKDSFVVLCANNGDHSDGIQTEGGGGANTLVQHNTFDQRPAEPNTTAPIFWQDTGVGGSTITDNLLIGGGYTVRVYIGPTTVTNNRIVNNPTSGWYGPVNSTCNVLTWSGNTLVTIDAAYNVTGTLGPVACTG
jgi:hypothetical protein